MGGDIQSEDWENQELEQKDIEYHRTLYPWGANDSRASNSRNAYWLVGGTIKSDRALTKDHQAFWKHATSWERAWSNLAFPGLPADPLIEGDSPTVIGSRMVVGHVAWFPENVIWTHPSAGTLSTGRWNFEAIVASQNPRPGYFSLPYGDQSRTTVNQWGLLVTDIGGRVFGALATRNSDAIESPWYGPQDLLLAIELVVSLTGTLVRKIVPTITSKLAKQTMSNEIRNLTSKEITSLEARELSPTYGRRWISTFDKGRGPFARPFYAKNPLPPPRGSGPANDVRLAKIYLESPKAQEQFAILEKELIRLESSGLSAPPPPPGVFRAFNPPRLVAGNLSKSAAKFKTLSKVSATLQHEEHIKLVMKKAAAEVIRWNLKKEHEEAAIAYDILVIEFQL